MDENLLVAFIQAITLLFTAIAAYLASKNSGKISAIGAKVDVIDNAQTAQMVSHGQVAAPVYNQPESAPYRYMSQGAKDFMTVDMTHENKESFLRQVAFNEAAKNVDYLISITGLGFCRIQNGQVIEDAMAHK